MTNLLFLRAKLNEVLLGTWAERRVAPGKLRDRPIPEHWPLKYALKELPRDTRRRAIDAAYKYRSCKLLLWIINSFLDWGLT